MFFGFTWTAIKIFDFPEKIEMLVSLYIYILMLDIVSDSYNSIINNFFINNIFEEFLIDGNNNELLFIIIDIVILLINGFFFSETEFLFF